MKKLIHRIAIFLILFTLPCINTFAQAPEKMSFQAVIRNSSNVLITSTTVGMRVSILHGSTTGTAVYVETQTPTTNANGLATIYIGAGTVVSGLFDSVHWGSGPFYVKVETDPTGGTSYSITATQQLVSVPYALFANYAMHSGDTSGGSSGTHPTLTTDSVNSVSYTSAKLYGNVSSDGGEFLIYKGFCVDTASLPSVSSSYIIGSALGSYSLTASGLLLNTHYHARAYATNSHGTAYGDTISFVTLTVSVPTITTDTVSSITSTTAVCGGDVTNSGGATVTTRGVCYDTIAYPTISSHLAVSGSDTGSFITTLSPLSTSHTYYARAYATNSVGTGYGMQRTFTTVLVSVPTISTDTVTSISYTSVLSGVTVTSAGGSTITWQGVCWSTSPYPTTSGSYLSTGTGVGDFAASVTGLTAGTTYYIRAFSTNTTGTAYGSQRTFTTLTLAVPTVSTNSVIGISATNATSGGNITSDGGTSVTARGVCWSRSGTPTIDSSTTSDGTGTGIYNSNMTGLSATTTYYVRAYATNSTGTGYGSVVTFTTDSIYTASPSLPVVGTDVPYITGSSYVCGGYVSFGGGSTVSARGVCWGTSSSPTISGSHSTDGTGLGYFTSYLTGLSGCGTTYYIRSYATNSTGTAYGNQYTISTGLLPTYSSDTITTIGTSSVVWGGTISGDGGCTITERGVCWSIYSSPTIATTHATSGSGTGYYTASVTSLAPTVTYHIRGYATNSVGTGYSAEQVITLSTPSTFYIGESYGGGLIFYIDSTGSHGLICAPTDQSSGSTYSAAQWGCLGTSVPGTSTALWTGAANTADIVAGCTTLGTAAYVCDTLTLGGYSDWYLPSESELLLMYDNLALVGLGSFATSYPAEYWTSSQNDIYTSYSQNYAYYIDFSTGSVSGYGYKSYYWYNTRAIRHF